MLKCIHKKNRKRVKSLLRFGMLGEQSENPQSGTSAHLPHGRKQLYRTGMRHLQRTVESRNRYLIFNI